MFVRYKTTPNSPRKTVQICKNYREGEKVKQKIVRYVGVAQDEDELNKLTILAKDIMLKLLKDEVNNGDQGQLFPSEDIICKLNKRGRPKTKKIEDILPPSEVSLDDIVEKTRIIEGVHEVGGKVFDDIYGYISLSKKDLNVFKDLVLARIILPASKHKSQKYLSANFGKEHSLDSIYRMMDKLYEIIPQIKQATFNNTKALFPEDKIDVLFFDVTTLYFESTNVDELRNFGYSKDHRFNTTQLVLALATNQDGLPIGYELFEGNKAEVTTLIDAVNSWKTLFEINSVCFVADRGLFTQKNIDLLKANNCKYIIAAKLRKLPGNLQNEILADHYYHPSIIDNQLTWTGEFTYGGDRLIVSYKSKRALKDSKDRQAILNKILKQLGESGNPNRLITNSGAKKFITKDLNASISIDNDKIKQEALWDGFHGVITNLDAPHSHILARYAKLWIIEESFRVNKHSLQMRPIFHFKPSRIHAHIAIAYASFAILRHIQYRVNLTKKISIDSILDELLNVQASIFVHKKTLDLYRIPGVFSHNASKIYKAFYIHRNLNASIFMN